MNIKYVSKRDGKIEEFDSSRIENAIYKAAASIKNNAEESFVLSKMPEIIDDIIRRLEDITNSSTVHIEDIQDAVERVLIGYSYDIGEAYILYRNSRSKIRDGKKLMIDINSVVDGYLDEADWRSKENSNVKYSLGGLILHNSSTITANYWLNNIYTKDIADAHKEAKFHIHDLGMLSGYCAGWSIRQLLSEGLGGVTDKVASRPPKHLSTACQQMVNFLGIMQNEWAGAQAFSSFDTYLAPFVKKDNLTDKEVKQSLQAFLFGVNTPSRWGSQAPFTNITLDWVVPQDIADHPVYIGGIKTDFKYKDCQKEMDTINRIFIELMLEGDANGRGFQYPIPTYNLTKDFDWNHPNCELLFKMTAKYGTPYFQNFISSDLNPSDVRSMCCRLQLDKRELRKRGGGLFGSDEFTGSIGVVTINLPQLGYLNKGKSKEVFFEELFKLTDIAIKSLQIKRKTITKLMELELFPYTKRYLKHFNNHFDTIGIIGTHECCLNYLGLDCGIDTETGRNFALEILDKLRAKAVEYQEEFGELVNIEAVPGESTSYRLALHDKKNYPDIITSGDNEAPYYTNSTWLPAQYTDDLFGALDHQDDLQIKYTGGTVVHVFVGESIKDWRACMELVKSIAENYRLPYFTISPTYSICPIHGFIYGEHFNCPKCKEMELRKIEDEISLLEEEKKSLLK